MPPWTVKLPEITHGPGLARREISFEGTPDTLPEPAADLVTATSRGRRLAPVARLHTSRRPYQVVDSNRRRLGEIVDDTVEVWRGERRTGGFREIEIEIDQPGPAQATVTRYQHGQARPRRMPDGGVGTQTGAGSQRAR